MDRDETSTFGGTHVPSSTEQVPAPKFSGAMMGLTLANVRRDRATWGRIAHGRWLGRKPLVIALLLGSEIHRHPRLLWATDSRLARLLSEFWTRTVSPSPYCTTRYLEKHQILAMAGLPNGTIIMTGSSGGLGSAIVDAIVSRPDLASSSHGIYTVRNVERAVGLNSVLGKAPSHPHDLVSLELSDLSSVRTTAEKINAQVAAKQIPAIRALILNAGYRDPPGQQTRTEGGLDMAFASNYLGHWLLTLLLLKSMDRQRGRIVVLGGWVHEYVCSTSPVCRCGSLTP